VSSRSGEAVLNALPAALAGALPDYLPSRRWYGDKARSIASLSIDTVVPIDARDCVAALAFASIQFETGESARYMIPVGWQATLPEGADPIAQLGDGWLFDGLQCPGVRAWFLSTMTAGSPGIVSDATCALQGRAGSSSRLLGAEQSNTSILYGDDVLIKVFRRLGTGINPDVELSKFLSARTSFTAIPAYLGSLSYDGAVIAAAQAFIANDGDGWHFVLGSLEQHLQTANPIELLQDARAIAGSLGRVTAEMHLGLASDPWTSDLAPEPIRRADVELWTSDYFEMLNRVVDALEERLAALDDRTRDLAQIFLDGAPGLRKRASGFEHLIGAAKTRVHGDYHLGQTLRTRDGGFVVIDFEGEPQRTIAERRRKTSPLKDVAGMLRSFSYARGTANGWLDGDSALLPSDLVAWEREARDAFVAAYLDVARQRKAGFLPASEGDFREALAAWELDKAAYEVLYELNNRPDWLWIPLSGMLKQSEP
jgi:trehalose synthase-fused probable maltokinase